MKQCTTQKVITSLPSSREFHAVEVEQKEPEWRRCDFPALDNSGYLKYGINFYPRHSSLYDYISVDLYKWASSDPKIGIMLYLNNHDAYKKLTAALKDKYELSLHQNWDPEDPENRKKKKKNGRYCAWVSFRLEKLEKEEVRDIFSIVDQVVPTVPPADRIDRAFSDILTKAVPAVTRVPWGTSLCTFNSAVSRLSKELKVSMEENAQADVRSVLRAGVHNHG